MNRKTKVCNVFLDQQTGSSLPHSCRRGQSSCRMGYPGGCPRSRDGIYRPYERFRPAMECWERRAASVVCHVKDRPHRTSVNKSYYQTGDNPNPVISATQPTAIGHYSYPIPQLQNSRNTTNRARKPHFIHLHYQYTPPTTHHASPPRTNPSILPPIPNKRLHPHNPLKVRLQILRTLQHATPCLTAAQIEPNRHTRSEPPCPVHRCGARVRLVFVVEDRDECGDGGG